MEASSSSLSSWLDVKQWASLLPSSVADRFFVQPNSGSESKTEPNEVEMGSCQSTLQSSMSIDLGNDYIVSWQAQTCQLIVTRKTHTVWQSVPGKAFVGTGTSPKCMEHYYFGFKVWSPPFVIHSDLQIIDVMEKDRKKNIVSLRGKLHLNSHRQSKGDANYVAVQIVPYEITFGLIKESQDRMFMHVDIDDNMAEQCGLNRTVLLQQTSHDEKIFGFGQQGQRIPILVREQGLGRGLQPLSFILNHFKEYAAGDDLCTYAPFPHYMTSTHRSFFLENREYSVFDLTHSNWVRVEVASMHVQAQLIQRETALDVIETFTEFSGRMRPLPDWISSGAIVGTQGGRAFVEDLHAKLTEQHDVPVASYWLQDWVGSRPAPWGMALWWTWEADDEKYPNWPAFVAYMKKEKHVRIMTYLNSYVADPIEKLPAVKRNLFQEIVERNMAVKDAKGDVYISYLTAAMFDLTNPETREWVKEIIKTKILANGVSGYMCDYGEGLPLDARLHHGKAHEFHNRYPEEWARVNCEAVKELGLEDEVVFFMRSAFLTSPKYTPLFWLGDQLQSWDEYDGFRSAVFGATVGGFSGISLTHADIGGYNCFHFDWLPLIRYVRTKELFYRGCEFAAFTAAFRTHDGTNKQKSWQLYTDDETIEFFERTAKIFVAWKFYRMKLMQIAYTKGHPMIQHMYLQFPNDKRVLDLKFQYMLGSELLVAPVVEEAAQTVHLYLPEGNWVHVWSDKIYQGPGDFIFSAPFGEPCVLYPEHSKVGYEFTQNLIDMKLRSAHVKP